ncbi:MAG TPA: AAA family ATPase, partial [Chloroflexota bacterium]
MAHGEGPVRLTPDVCEAAAARIERVLFEVKKVIVGQEAMLERAMVALVARGHALLEGVPGLAKTLTVKTLAQALDLQFKRIQFTPDLVPADLLGTRVYNPKTGEFSTELGPVFANLVLADEINRAPAKVQSALLEVMQEHQVTIGGRTYPVPEPFLVMATQNPIESEGTYALPEAQVDRFMFKVLLDYPSPAEEAAIVGRMTAATRLAVEPVLDARGLLELQDLADLVYVDPQVVDYTTALIRATRHPEAVGLKDLSRYVLYGASPRTTV